MGTKKGKDGHEPEPKLNNRGIAETSSESFNTLISHSVQKLSSRRAGAVGGLIANNAQQKWTRRVCRAAKGPKAKEK